MTDDALIEVARMIREAEIAARNRITARQLGELFQPQWSPNAKELLPASA